MANLDKRVQFSNPIKGREPGWQERHFGHHHHRRYSALPYSNQVSAGLETLFANMSPHAQLLPTYLRVYVHTYVSMERTYSEPRVGEQTSKKATRSDGWIGLQACIERILILPCTHEVVRIYGRSAAHTQQQ